MDYGLSSRLEYGSGASYGSSENSSASAISYDAFIPTPIPSPNRCGGGCRVCTGRCKI